MNTIKWTSELNKYFKENEKNDPSLLWQYFGSAEGVYRVYPGKIQLNLSKYCVRKFTNLPSDNLDSTTDKYLRKCGRLALAFGFVVVKTCILLKKKRNY